MKSVLAKARGFLKSESGPTTVEYAVMLALIVAVAIGTLALLAPKIDRVAESAIEQELPG